MHMTTQNESDRGWDKLAHRLTQVLRRGAPSLAQAEADYLEAEEPAMQRKSGGGKTRSSPERRDRNLQFKLSLELLEERQLLDTSGALADMLKPDPIFDEGTDLSTIAKTEDVFLMEHVLSDVRTEPAWGVAALGSDYVGPIELTWSIVPDGTPILGFNGDQTAPSDLVAFLDAKYSSAPGAIEDRSWFPLIEQSFQVWAPASGVRLRYESADDGAALVFAPGQAGVRGDIRIGGHPIDGNRGTLAYSFFPPHGDIVIDTADNAFNNTSYDSRTLRNVLGHEFGHVAFAMPHTFPSDGSKLMEPILVRTIDGPQSDDIYEANRRTGDRMEPNNTIVAATDLGQIGQGTHASEQLSINGTTDVDMFKFTVNTGMEVDLNVAPEGTTYLRGNSAEHVVPFNAAAQNDLVLELLSADQSTVLGRADQTAAGSAEILQGVNLGAGGTFYIRVSGKEPGTQMFRLVAETRPRTSVASQFVVDRATDTIDIAPGDGVARDRDGLVSLRAAIMEANALPGEQTIVLPAGRVALTIGETGELGDAGGDLDITDDLTIIGAGPDAAIIDAGDQFRIFDVHSNTYLTLQGVTLTHGRGGVDDQGGGIRSELGHVRLVDVALTHNSVPQRSGGAIYAKGGTLDIVGAQFQFNSAENGGGGCIYAIDGSVTIEDAVIANCRAEYGGAIANFGEMTITNSSVTQSVATTIGGGIDHEGDEALRIVRSVISADEAAYGGGISAGAGSVVVQETTIIGNVSSASGGCINLGGSATLNIIDSTLVGCRADSGAGLAHRGSGLLTVSGSSFRGNVAEQMGGAVWTQGQASIRTSDITGNVALNWFGGGIAVTDGGSLTLDASTVADNVAESDGGGIATFANATVHIIDSRVTGSDVESGRGAAGIQNDATSTITVQGSTVTGNGVASGSADVHGNFGSLGNNVIARVGSATGFVHGVNGDQILVRQDRDVILVNSFADAVDANPGDGIAAAADGSVSLRAAIMESNALPGMQTIVLQAGVFSLTRAGADEDFAVTGDLDIRGDLIIRGAGQQQTIIDGRGLDRAFDIFPGASVTVEGVSITNGRVTGDGGGVRNAGRLVLRSSTISDGVADGPGARGGGIFNAGELTVVASTLMRNQVPMSVMGGGGMYNTGPLLTIVDSTVSDNFAQNGGGLYSYYSAQTNISGSSILRNTAGEMGGGIFNLAGNENSILTVTNVTLSGNTAGTRGGAIHNDNSELIVRDSALLDNTAGTWGGAVSNHGTLVIRETTLSNNQADLGGAVSNIWSNNSVVETSDFSHNSARYGGAVWNWSNDAAPWETGPMTKLTIADSTFDHNQATQRGGAIVNDNGVLEIVRCTVSSNTSLNEGGGLWNANAFLTMAESAFAANSAIVGGGIYNSQYTIRGAISISGTTIAENTADIVGGGVYNHLSSSYSIRAQDTLIAKNRATSGSPDVYGSFDSLGNNLVGNAAGSSGFSGPSDLTGDGAAPLDPRLGPFGDNGGPTFTFALLIGSPAIDAGSNNFATATDQRGVPRRQDGDDDGTSMRDIGSVEFVPNDRLKLNPTPDPFIAAKGSGVQSIVLSGISAGAGEAQSLSVTVSADNTGLVLNPRVQYVPGQANATVSFTPASDRTGNAQITLTLRDSGPDGVPGNSDDATQSRVIPIWIIDGQVVRGTAGSGDGAIHQRSAAPFVDVLWLRAGESRTYPVTISEPGVYAVRLLTSNDNLPPPAALESMRVRWDGVDVGTIIAPDSGAQGFGLDWNTGTISDPTSPFVANSGQHSLQIAVTGGDGYGVETWTVVLERLYELPRISISDAEMAEGHTGTRPVAFKVSLSQPFSFPVSLLLSTADWTASAADLDYVPIRDELLVFAPGETVKPGSVRIRGDQRVEGNERFLVVASSPINAILGDAFATVLILEPPDGTFDNNVTSVEPQDSPPGEVVTLIGSGLFGIFEVLAYPPAADRGAPQNATVTGSSDNQVSIIAPPSGLTRYSPLVMRDGDSAAIVVRNEFVDIQPHVRRGTNNSFYQIQFGAVFDGPSNANLFYVENGATLTLSDGTGKTVFVEDGGVVHMASGTPTIYHEPGATINAPLTTTLVSLDRVQVNLIDVGGPDNNNQVPVANDDFYVVTAGQTLQVDAAAGVLSNDHDPDGDPIEAYVTSSPQHGQLVFHPDGSFTYTATQSSSGPSGPAPTGSGGSSYTDTFVYIAADGNSVSATTIVSILVETSPELLVDEVPDPRDVDRTAPQIRNIELTPFGRAIGQLRLTATEPLDAALAEELRNYSLLDPGRDGRFSSRDDRQIPVTSAVYDSALAAVTLSARGLRQNRFYQLTVSSVVTDVVGNRLDGNQDGLPGDSFFVVTGLGTRLNYVDADGDSALLQTQRGGMLQLAITPTSDGERRHLRLVDSRTGQSTLLGGVKRGAAGDGIFAIDVISGLSGVQDRLNRRSFEIRDISAQALDAVLSDGLR